eukprot:COSAG01_NODE_9763_length_2350_cov_69.696135_2_plen_259_part_00
MVSSARKTRSAGGGGEDKPDDRKNKLETAKAVVHVVDVKLKDICGHKDARYTYNFLVGAVLPPPPPGKSKPVPIVNLSKTGEICIAALHHVVEAMEELDASKKTRNDCGVKVKENQQDLDNVLAEHEKIKRQIALLFDDAQDYLGAGNGYWHPSQDSWLRSVLARHHELPALIMMHQPPLERIGSGGVWGLGSLFEPASLTAFGAFWAGFCCNALLSSDWVLSCCCHEQRRWWRSTRNRSVAFAAATSMQITAARSQE